MMVYMPWLVYSCATGFTGHVMGRWVVGLFLGLMGGLLAFRRKFIGMYLLTVATTGLAAIFLTFGVLMLPGDAAVMGFLSLFRGIGGFSRETVQAIVPYGWWVCWALVVLPWYLYCAKRQSGHRTKRQSGWLFTAIVLTVLSMMGALGAAVLLFGGGVD